VRLVVANASPIIDIHSGRGQHLPAPRVRAGAVVLRVQRFAHRLVREHVVRPPLPCSSRGEDVQEQGQLFTARDLFAKGHEPAAVRLELIRTHHRLNANFTEQGLKDSQRMVDRWRWASRRARAREAGARRPR